MNNDPILTGGMIAVAGFLFLVVYIAPVAAVVTGIVLLKKSPKTKIPGLVLLLIGLALFAAVVVWKTGGIF
jgi:hypothetical protein